MAYTTPATATSGGVLTAATWNASVRDDIIYLQDRVDNPPRANVTHSTAQSLATATATALVFDSEYSDSAALHSTVSNTSRLTIPSGQGGWWLFSAYCEFAAAATGQRQLYLAVNTTSIIAYTTVDAAASGVTRLAVTGVFNATAGQYGEVFAWQNTGGALNVAAFPYFAAQRIA